MFLLNFRICIKEPSIQPTTLGNPVVISNKDIECKEHLGFFGTVL